MLMEWLLLGTPSFKLTMENVALVWPLGMVTTDGAVASFVALEASVTSRLLFGGVLRQTTALVAGFRPLDTTLLAIASLSAGPSSSWTISSCEATLPTAPPNASRTWAERRVSFGPLAMLSFTAAT